MDKSLVQGIFYLIVIIIGIIFLKYKINIDDKKSDYSNISYDSLFEENKIQKVTHQKKFQNENYDLILEIEMWMVATFKPKFTKALYQYIYSQNNKFFTFQGNNYVLLDVKNHTELIDGKKRPLNILIFARDIDAMPRQEIRQTNNIRTNYGTINNNVNNSVHVNNLIESYKSFNQNNKLNPEDSKALNDFLINLKNNTSNDNERNFIVKLLKNYGEAAAGLVAIIKSIVF